MKHIFVINPAAGKTNVTEALLPVCMPFLSGGRRSWKPT